MNSDDIKNENIPFVDVEKPIKSWGTAGNILETTGSTLFVQSPTDEELKAAKLEKGSDSTTYTFTTDNTNEVIAAFTSYAEKDQPCYEITGTEQQGGIWNVQIIKTILKNVIEGQESEDDVDYGTDGEGNIDYDDWSTQRKAKITNDKWYLEWDDVKNWPPFSQYGVQWIDTWTLAAYKEMCNGGKLLGDLVEITAFDKTPHILPLRDFVHTTDLETKGVLDHDDYINFLTDVNGNGDLGLTRHTYAYKRLWEETCLVLVHTWSKQWVISKQRFRMNFENMTEDEQEFMDTNKGVLVTTECQGNEDGKETREMDESGNPIIDSKTYTVTRTWTWKRLWDKSMVQQIPIGMTFKVPEKPKKENN